jgi:mannobiose 2-epimerase
MNDTLKRLWDWAERDLHENLLAWWSKNVMSDPNGFYGRVGPKGDIDADADRFIVLSARLLWTYSAAFRVTGVKEYKAFAEQAYRSFVKWFYDDVHGGFYSSVDKNGIPSMSHKMVYGNAFAVYGLSEYVRITGDAEALRLAKETVRRMDEKIYDPLYMGYFETASRDWSWTPGVRGVNRGGDDQKTMNTHLHMIEAYTNLLRVHEDPALRSRVREMLYLFLHYMTNRATHHFHAFLDRAWKPLTPEQSFGHDIEGSWLLMEAAEVLGEEQAIKDTTPVCINIARAVNDDGFSKDGLLIMEYHPVSKHYTERYSWWVQNEAIVGFLNAWQMTGEEAFLNRAVSVLDISSHHFIDREQGGWHAALGSDLKPLKHYDKAGPFICPYHDVRMYLEIIERLQPTRW